MLIALALSACGDAGPSKAETDARSEQQARAAAVPLLEMVFDVMQPLKDALELAKQQPPVVGPFIDAAQHGDLAEVVAAQGTTFDALKIPPSLADSDRSITAGFTDLRAAVMEMTKATQGPAAGVPLQVNVAEAKLDAALNTLYSGVRTMFPTGSPSIVGPGGGTPSGRPRSRTRAAYLLAVGRACAASEVQLGTVKGADVAALKAGGDIISAGIGLVLKEAPPPADAAMVQATIAVPLRKSQTYIQQLLAVVAKPGSATQKQITALAVSGTAALSAVAAGMRKYGSATCDLFFTAAA
jgi:hypothetical protein